jgi:hypothetical protein
VCGASLGAATCAHNENTSVHTSGGSTWRLPPAKAVAPTHALRGGKHPADAALGESHASSRARMGATLRGADVVLTSL